MAIPPMILFNAIDMGDAHVIDWHTRVVTRAIQRTYEVQYPFDVFEGIMLDEDLQPTPFIEGRALLWFTAMGFQGRDNQPRYRDLWELVVTLKWLQFGGGVPPNIMARPFAPLTPIR